MGRITDRPLSAEELRQTAEVLFADRPSASKLSGHEPQALLHELGVHQIELEMQNDELRHAHLELEVSRDRYAALYDNAPFGYLTIDRKGVIVECNLTAAALLRRDRIRVLGLKLQSLMSRGDADAFHRQQRELLRSGGKQTCEVDLQRADGRNFRASLDLIVDAGATADPRTNVAVIDLTELRGTQADLHASEARFQLIAANVQDMLYLRELDGVVSYVSPAYERIWGRPASPLGRKPTGWLDTVEPEDRQQVWQAWERLRGGTPISVVYRIRRPDGALRWVHSRGFPIGDKDGRQRSVGVVRDVTHERMPEQALRHAQKMEAVGTLASGVAHNIRNVLQAILNFIQVIRLKTEAGEPIVEMLDRVNNATGRGAELIDQLVMFARKQDALSLSRVRVDDVLREAAGLIRPLVTEMVSLEIDAGAPDAIVMADPVQLEQVLLNLAANARDAMPRGGTLAITSREVVLDEPSAKARRLSPGPQVVLTVKDSGEGMDAETKARVFEPFFTTKGVGQGTGLGLSTVFAVVQQFGGSIEVDSAPGAGSTFTITLPASP